MTSLKVQNRKTRKEEKETDPLAFWTDLLVSKLGHNRAQTLLKEVRHDHNLALNTGGCSAASARLGMVHSVKKLAEGAVFNKLTH